MNKEGYKNQGKNIQPCVSKSNLLRVMVCKEWYAKRCLSSVKCLFTRKVMSRVFKVFAKYSGLISLVKTSFGLFWLMTINDWFDQLRPAIWNSIPDNGSYSKLKPIAIIVSCNSLVPLPNELNFIPKAIFIYLSFRLYLFLRLSLAKICTF